MDYLYILDIGILAYFHKPHKKPIILDRSNRKLININTSELAEVKLTHNAGFWNKFFNYKSKKILAKEGKELSHIFKLKASSKAIKQWERIFKNKRRLKKYHLDGLDKYQKISLLNYLIKYAADSDLVEAAGFYK